MSEATGRKIIASLEQLQFEAIVSELSSTRHDDKHQHLQVHDSPLRVATQKDGHLGGRSQA